MHGATKPYETFDSSKIKFKLTRKNKYFSSGREKENLHFEAALFNFIQNKFPAISNEPINIIFQVFTREICSEEIQKVLPIHHDPSAINQDSGSDLLQQWPHEGHEYEDGHACADAQHGQCQSRS